MQRADVHIEVESPKWRAVQTRLTQLFDAAAGDMRARWTYQGLFDYLTESSGACVDAALEIGDFAAEMSCRSDPSGPSPYARALRQIRQVVGADGDVYLANGHGFVREALAQEYPELRDAKRAFAEALVPGYYVETEQFVRARKGLLRRDYTGGISVADL
jgi:hypothetical protein